MKLGHMLRVCHDNGLNLEFAFDTEAGCSLAYRGVAEAMRDATITEISDDMGHVSLVVGGKVVHLQSVDLEEEAGGKVYLSHLIQSTQQTIADAMKARAASQLVAPRQGIVDAVGRPVRGLA